MKPSSNRIKRLCFYIAYDMRKESLRVVSGEFVNTHNWIIPLESSNGWKLESKSESQCQLILGQIISSLDIPAKDMMKNNLLIDNLIHVYKPLLDN